MRHLQLFLLFFSSFLQITKRYFEMLYARLIPHSLLVIVYGRQSNQLYLTPTHSLHMEELKGMNLTAATARVEERTMNNQYTKQVLTNSRHRNV